MAVLNSLEYESDSGVQWYLDALPSPVGPSMFNAITTMDKDLASATRLPDTTRLNCLTCA